MMRNPIRGVTLRATYSRVLPDGMCHGEINQEPAVTHADGTDEKRNHHRSNRRAVRRDGSEDGGTTAGTDDNRPDTGGDSGVGGESGCSDTEPP